jgi:hypothetical protein
MNGSILSSLVIYAALFFVAGWGWGQWWAERCARRDKSAMERGRMTVSMPVDPDKAALTLRALSALMAQVDAGHHTAPDGEQKRAAHV